MDTILFTVLILLGSICAGFLGALSGLGGGVVIVPLLTIAFGVDIRYAMGASLVCVIATSSGAAAAYVREGFSNIRIGMFLEIATTVGAIVGALAVARLSASTISVIFGLVLVYSAISSVRPREDDGGNGKSDPLARWLKLDGKYPSEQGERSYNVQGVPLGFGLMFAAGTISGLLGIGSGAVKVMAMDRVMRLPFKVSTTTSNFMIGVTAAASAGIYLNRGYIDPFLSMPVVLGVLLGALLGARKLAKARTKNLRFVFAGIVLLLAVEMIYSGLKRGL
jgi:uncharacterized protein